MRIFEPGIAKNYLKRFWPFWALYLLIQLLTLPIVINSGQFHRYPEEQTLLFGDGMYFLGAGAGPVIAMAMLHYLYTAKSANWMASLPVRRETMYLTLYLTGLVPMLASNLLVSCILALALGPDFGFAARWLLQCSLGSFSFYSLAFFCGQLTGSLWGLPVIYLIFNFGAWALEYGVSSILRKILLGYTYSGKLNCLSPIVYLGQEGFRVHDHMVYAWLFAGACLALLVGGFFIYRARRMEAASDLIAQKPLRPVAKYFMTLISAVLFAALLDALIYSYDSGARPVSIALFALIGAAVGYFGTEMLMKRTVKVFAGSWKGFAAAAGVIVLALALAFLDPMGYSSFVPEPEDVASVRIPSYNILLEEPENIRQVTELHKEVLADNPDKVRGDYCSIEYTMKDGRTVVRAYNLNRYGEVYNNKLRSISSQPENLLRVLNSARQSRDSNLDIRISVGFEEIHLTGFGARDFLENALTPDAQEGRLTLNDYSAKDSYIFISSRTGEEGYFSNVQLFYSESSVRTVSWLREHKYM